MALFQAKITGNTSGVGNSRQFGVYGTDLGIPYAANADASRVHFLFGDTFSTLAPGEAATPGSGADWRSPVLLSSTDPSFVPKTWDIAAGTSTWAKEICFNAHNTSGNWREEFSVIPNDGIYLPETDRHIMQFQSINRWDGVGSTNANAMWRTGYSSMAYSDNGGQDWTRVPFLAWENQPDNLDPFQMVTMHREGDYVYFISVRAGRQSGPMMLRRCHYMHLFEKNWYEGWGWNGSNWGWGRPCTSIFPEKRYGEPSLRKIRNKWVLGYVDYSRKNIWGQEFPTYVTRTADAIDGLWTAEKTQVTFSQLPNIYGGFIDPRPGVEANEIIVYLSRWSHSPIPPNPTTHYHVEQWICTL